MIQPDILFDQLSALIEEPNRHLMPAKEGFTGRKSFVLKKVRPAETLSLSTTGTSCQQNCAHCNGHYLRGMQSLPSLSSEKLSAYSSILVSGGSNLEGAVNIAEHFDSIMQLPKDKTLNVHPGFQPAANFLPLKERNPVISFDLPGNSNVIREVYRLPYEPGDYQRLFKDYRAHFKTVPHITIGLNRGEYSGERETIDFLAGEKVEEVVFIVFRPTPGTEMADCPTPSLSHIVDILSYAGSQISGEITLGCMRPAGPLRRQTDILAWLTGVEKIVHPDHLFASILEANFVKIIETKNCCAI